MSFGKYFETKFSWCSCEKLFILGVNLRVLLKSQHFYFKSLIPNSLLFLEYLIIVCCFFLLFLGSFSFWIRRFSFQQYSFLSVTFSEVANLSLHSLYLFSILGPVFPSFFNLGAPIPIFFLTIYVPTFFRYDRTIVIFCIPVFLLLINLIPSGFHFFSSYSVLCGDL